MVKKIKILGVPYTVHFVSYENNKELATRFGYTAVKDRKIVIGDLNTLDDWKNESKAAKDRQHAETVRHEVVHAFLYESGLWGCSKKSDRWAMDEEIIDWIAIQMPKIVAVCKELESI